MPWKRPASKSAQKGSFHADKVLIDTSTFFDIRKAPKNAQSAWAQNTIQKLVQYQAYHPKLTVSAFTVFEHLDGLYRKGRDEDAAFFLAKIVPSLEVIYPDEEIYAIAAQVNAALAVTGKTIGLADAFIASTAIAKKLSCVFQSIRPPIPK